MDHGPSGAQGYSIISNDFWQGEGRLSSISRCPFLLWDRLWSIEIHVRLPSFAVPRALETHQQHQSKGEPIDFLKSYSVVACERDGNPEDVLCRIDHMSNPQPLGITLHSVMRSYLSEFSPVSPAVEVRIVATDVGHGLLSPLEGYDYQFW